MEPTSSPTLLTSSDPFSMPQESSKQETFLPSVASVSNTVESPQSEVSSSPTSLKQPSLSPIKPPTVVQPSSQPSTPTESKTVTTSVTTTPTKGSIPASKKASGRPTKWNQELDNTLITLSVELEPWNLKRGQLGKLWEKIAAKLSEQQQQRSSKFLPFSASQCQSRLHTICSNMKDKKITEESSTFEVTVIRDVLPFIKLKEDNHHREKTSNGTNASSGTPPPPPPRVSSTPPESTTTVKKSPLLHGQQHPSSSPLATLAHAAGKKRKHSELDSTVLYNIQKACERQADISQRILDVLQTDILKREGRDQEKIEIRSREINLIKALILQKE